MTTAYIYRFIIYVDIINPNPVSGAARLAAANNAARAWDPDTGGGETFGGALLSADGNEPASHTMCATMATEEMRTGILNAFTNIPFAAVYDVAEGWTVASTLSDMGLQIIQ